MNFRNLTNPECGQSNPLDQLASHFTQDHTLQSRIGGLPTDSSFMPPQSFRMNDLLQEINQLDSEGAAGYPADPNASNLDVAWESLSVERVHFERQPSPRYSNIHWVPPRTPYQERIPQAMRFPPEPQPEQMADSFDSEKYTIINSLDELVNVQENTEEVKEVRNTSIQSRVEQSSQGVEGLHEEITKLIGIEFEALKKKKQQQIILENSIHQMTLLQKGLKLLIEGDITGAIICFEDVVKEGETCANNWKLLGTTYMKNMQVEKAIRALEQGLQLEPHNLDILMALAENYATNQDIPETLTTLLSWLKNHPEYKDVVPKDFDHVSLSEEIFHKAIVNMFIKAAQRRPIDYDYQVQSVLGLLLLLNRNYDKAIDCFRSALLVKPHDPMLWNQLGITLGRLCKHEEAIDHFDHALSVDPAFLPAKLNIGLTWLNRKNFKEAAKHFLLILNRQTLGQSGNTLINYTSTKTWNLLHRCMSNMNRRDLLEAVLERDLKILNREFDIS